jgi:eukaryotic-like serine/threonine-protein kinase
MAEILLGKLLGPGGFERAVVVKRALPHLTRQAEFREMFLDEARIIARIQHPNVVNVSELGQEGHELFMVMEYLAGESVNGFTRRLASRPELRDPTLAAYIIAEAAAGLHAAHELRTDTGELMELVHRDVSPQNVFLTYDGNVKMLDFGIAHFADRQVETQAGQLKGKFSYMSPEQCCSEKLDRRSDVFSLGILLWELLSGSRLFQRNNELLVWKAIVEEPIPLPSEHLGSGMPLIPEQLEAITMKALAREADDRYQTAADLRHDLLVAIQEMKSVRQDREHLASVMRKLFADRISQKEEMLRRVRAGDVNLQVPTAEVDDQVEGISTAVWSEELRPLSTDPGLAALPPLSTDPTAEGGSEASALSARSSGRGWAFVGAFGMLVAGALGFWLIRGPAPEPPRPAPPVAAAEPRAPIPSVPTAPSTPSPTVTVVVDTDPPNARVWVNDEERGIAPLTVMLARGSEPARFTLRLPGYREQVREVVPSVDQQTLIVTLARERRQQTRPPPPDDDDGIVRFRRLD